MIRFGVLLFWFQCALAYGATCSAVFNNPAASYSSSGYIQFQPQASLIGSDGVLDFASMTDNSGGTSCDSAACSVSGNSSSSMSGVTFQYSSSSTDRYISDNSTETLAPGEYKNVTLGNGSSLTATSSDNTFKIKSLSVNYNAIVTLQAGIYWIETLNLGQNAQLQVASGQKVVIYTRSFSTNISNQVNSNGDAYQLLVYSEGNITFGQYSQVKGYFYALGSASYSTDVSHTGAVNANQVVMQDRAEITYDSTGQETLNPDGMCSQSVYLPNPIAHWTLNACFLYGGGGEIVDSVAGNNGQSYESPSVDTDGKLCQAVYFRGDTDHLRIPHSSAYEVSQGAVSFWMNTENLAFFNNTQDGGMALISKDEMGTGNGQFTILVTPGGAIKVNQEASGVTYQLNTSPVIIENQWHHVVYTFGADGMKVFVDNIEVGSNTSYTSGWGGNSRTLVVAANASRHDSANSTYSDMGDYYQGRIDDVRFYNQQLSDEQIILLNNESEDSCTDCTSNPNLLSHWQMDVCSLDGTSGEIVDIKGGNNGRSLDGASSVSNGRYCQSVGFDGNNDHINIPHISAYEMSEGAISLWVKVTDLQYNADHHGNSRQAIFSKDSDGRDNGDQFTLLVDQDGKLILHHETATNTYDIYTGAVLTERERWHHIVYDWGPGGMHVFTDGKYLGSFTDTGFSWQQNREPIILGASAMNSGNNVSNSWELRDHMKGEIDDVRVYSNQLGLPDVQELYTASDYSCTACDGEDPTIFYQFEQTSWSGTGSVIDSSPAGQHGNPMGGATPQIPTNDVSCSAMDVPYNTEWEQQDGADSVLDLNSVGGRGTISFWYRSDTPWIGGGNRQLFDATKGEYRYNSYHDRYDVWGQTFYMSLNNDGKLGFGMEDASGNNLDVLANELGYAANEWVHIALLWDMPNGDIDLYVNGSRVFMYGYLTLSNPDMANVSSLKIGDNSSYYFTGYMTDNSANGQFDDVRVYDYQQTRDQIRDDMDNTTSCYNVHHYEISHPTQALTCSSAAITIKACTNASCSELMPDPVTITLPAGDWSGGNTLTFTGSVDMTLAQSISGTFPISVTAGNRDSAPENSAQCTSDCNVEFVNAGFEFFDSAATYSATLPDVIAESDLGSIGLRAVQNNAGACEALLTGTQYVNLSFDCVSDSNAPNSPDQCSVPFAGIPISGDGSSANSGTLALTFDSDGETTLSGFSYADAGRLSLSAQAIVGGININSGSNEFDSIPAQLVLSSDVTSPVIAGTTFGLSVTALGANDGVLTGYSPGNLQMAVQRILPASSSASETQLFISGSQSVTSATSVSWTNISSPTFSSGQWSYASAYLTEVGSFTLDVQDSAYLGSVIDADSLSLGRSIPAYFDVTASTTPQLEDQCSSQFTYIGQPFGFTTGTEPELSVTAYNASGQVTMNYADSSLWALNPDSSSLSAIAVADSSAYSGGLTTLSVGSAPVITEQANYDGEGTISLLNTSLQYNKIATPSAAAGMGSPFEGNVSLTFGAAFLTDDDGICYQTDYPNRCESFSFASVQGSEMRYGRIRLENTFGPEAEALTMPVVGEYYNAGEWMLNSKDSCTSVTFAQSSGQLSITSTSMGNDEQDLTSSIPSLSSTGVLSTGKAPTGVISIGPAVSGGTALRGSVRVSLEPGAAGADWADYLNVDWDGDGDIDGDDKPTAEAFFGIYRGSDRTIHLREGY